MNLSAQDAVHHDDDKTLQRVKDGEEDLKEDGALVCHGEHRRHPGESQQRQDHTGAPQGCPERKGRRDISADGRKMGQSTPFWGGGGFLLLRACVQRKTSASV